MKYLTSNDANINDLTPTGYTAMHMAAMNGHVSVVKVLAAMGMMVDCRTVDEQTPLHMAAMRSVQTLLRKTTVFHGSAY